MAKAKRIARMVPFRCAKCGVYGSGREKTIAKCAECGQANSVLAMSPVTQPKAKNLKAKQGCRRPGFDKEAAEMLQSLHTEPELPLETPDEELTGSETREPGPGVHQGD